MDAKKILESAIEELNDLRDDTEQIPEAFTGALLGPHGVLDSLGTATLILGIESKVQENLGRSIDIASILLQEDMLSIDYSAADLLKLINEQL